MNCAKSKQWASFRDTDFKGTGASLLFFKELIRVNWSALREIDMSSCQSIA
jgi:hypothetical protein